MWLGSLPSRCNERIEGCGEEVEGCGEKYEWRDGLHGMDDRMNGSAVVYHGVLAIRLIG